MTEELARLVDVGVDPATAAVLASTCARHRRARSRVHRCSDCRYRVLSL